jgi:hypothetical protein
METCVYYQADLMRCNSDVYHQAISQGRPDKITQDISDVRNMLITTHTHQCQVIKKEIVSRATNSFICR